MFSLYGTLPDHLKVNTGFYTYQTKTRLEVDFFVPPAAIADRALIQICLSRENVETRDREIRAIVTAAKELNVKRLFVLTCHEAEQCFRQDGYEIIAVPAWKILLRAAIWS